MAGLSPKSTKCSLFWQMTHEFHCAAREHIKTGAQETEIRRTIHALIASHKKEAIWLAISILVLAAAISNLGDGGVVKVSTPIGDISAPKIYLIFAGAFSWASLVFMSLQMVQLIVLSEKVRYFSRHPGRFVAAQNAILGIDTFDFISPLRNGHHFQLNFKFQSALTFLLTAFIVIGVIPFFGSVLLFLGAAFAQFGTDYGYFLEDTAALCSIVLVIVPPIYLIFFFIPVSIRKSETGVYASKFYRNRRLDFLMLNRD